MKNPEKLLWIFSGHPGIAKETPVLESLFNEVAGLACILLNMRL